MAADRFWGRIFRSKYFQSGIGLAERQQEATDDDASEFVAAFSKHKVQKLYCCNSRCSCFVFADKLAIFRTIL